jgi:ADP-ribose pyrophosphatase YjhB (NUDIX family)
MRGGKVLVVREKLKPTGWKLPGGYLNLGEDIEAGLAREVKEETGVDAAFTRVLSFRNQHNVQFGRSDIYVIAEMEAQTEAIRVDSEIEEARWMPLEEFRGATSHPMLQRALAQVTTPSAGFKGTVMKSTIPGRAPFTLYS